MKAKRVLTVAGLSLLLCALFARVGGQSLKSGQPSRDAFPPPAIHFEDIAPQTGLTALNIYGGDTHKEYILETTGNGAVIFDYDNDGWPDLYLANGSRVEGFPEGNPPTGHLYHNNRDGTFTDVTERSGLAHAGWAQGACAGDYDNDGYVDLFVTYWGQSLLYHNNGNGTFTDVTEKAGLKSNKTEWTTGCSFLDYDRDGSLDLFVARYVDFNYERVPKAGRGPFCQWKGLNVMCGPRGLPSGVNGLYHNQGKGTFSDVSKQSGILDYPMCYGLTSLPGDYDDDGWTDIFVACDSTPNVLYHNNHDGTFRNLAGMAGVAYNEDGTEQAGMGLAAADYMHSGHESILKTNFSDDTPTLYLNRGHNDFEDVTYRSGLGKIRNWLGWGVQFYDFDNSGWPGILIANGHVYPEVDGKGLGTSYREPKVAYYNLRNGEFRNITSQVGRVLTELHSARGMALGDLFNDGHLEALVNNMNETPSLYYNTGPVDDFISLQLIGVKSNRSAVGAVATLFQGTDRSRQEVRSGGGYVSQNDLRLHFGLGTAKKADLISIRWPSGAIETLRDLAANQYYVVREGSGIDPRLTHGVSKVQIKVPPSARK